MKMEMRASEFIPIAQDLTPPLPPMAFCLHSSFLSSHCSSCSLPLPHASPHSDSSLLYYCSPLCSSFDSPLHFSSGEPHLRSLPPSYPIDSSSLRLALRLLHLLQIKAPAFFSKERICGLMTNYEKFMTVEDGEGEIVDEDYGVLRTIKEGSRVLALARILRNGSGSDLHLDLDSGLMIEEAMMCLVMTNAVEVQEKSGRCIGIAVYDVGFSWINHSCSPNACYRFSTRNDGNKGLNLGFRISSAAVNNGCNSELVNDSEVANFKYLPGNGPRIIVRSIKEIKKGEEITFAYTDLLRPKAIRQSELWLKYRFSCLCKRCSSTPITYVDSALQGLHICNVETFTDLQDCFDVAIGEYLALGNPVSCCEKLEKLLTCVYLDTQLELKKQESGLKPQSLLFNHLFLDAYTTLSSAYKFRANELLCLDPVHDAALKVEALEMSKVSAAYSLLLAGMVHHLFLYETSFIASAVNFLFSAGESVLSLAKSSFWEPSCTVLGPSCIPDHTCYQTAQLKRFLLCGEERFFQFEEISRQFVNCAAYAIKNTWSFLTCGCRAGFLDQIKDLDIKSFWAKEKDYFNMSGKLKSSSMSWHNNAVRIDLYNLGIHCLMYAAFLSCICYGQDSEVACNVVSILVSEGVLTAHHLFTC